MGKEKKPAVKQPGGKKSSLSWYKRMDFSKKTALWGMIFLLPWLIGVIFFFLRPLVNTFWYSLCSMDMVNGKLTGNFIGVDNYKWVLGVNPDFTKHLATVFISMLQEVPFQIFIALFIAILLNGEYRGRGFFRAVFVIPIILATGVATFNLGEVSMTEQSAESVMNMAWLQDLVVNSGLPENLTSLLVEYVQNIFTVVTTCGVQVLLFLAGLQAISPSLYEVAKMEGCTQFETFCKITLPMVSPTILVCLVYSIAESFANVTVEQGDTTMKFAEYIQKITFNGQPAYFGYGAAMSFIFFATSLAAIGIICGIVSKGVFYYD